MEMKKVEKLLNNAECGIVITNRGCGMEGTGLQIIGLFTMLVDQLKENFTKEQLQDALDRGYKSTDELVEELKGLLKNLGKTLDEMKDEINK